VVEEAQQRLAGSVSQRPTALHHFYCLIRVGVRAQDAHNKLHARQAEADSSLVAHGVDAPQTSTAQQKQLSKSSSRNQQPAAHGQKLTPKLPLSYSLEVPASDTRRD